MNETRQAQFSDIYEILQVLQSVVSQSVLSTSVSKSPEEIHLEANIFPVITCFAKVIRFVNEGSVSVPQVLLSQFLEVAKILNIVQENVHEDVNEEDAGDEYLHEENLGDEDLDEWVEDIRDNLWWDDTVHQYQLYWEDDDDEDGDDVFATEQSEEDDEDFSIADRVKARRARLGAIAGDDRIQSSSTSPTPRQWPTPATSSPPPPRSTTPQTATSPRLTACSPLPRRDPFISALLRTINRTAPKSVYSTKKAEILREERSNIRIANIVPDEFKSLWDAHEDEEDVKIIVPDPYPTIDWTKVNKRFISNIPEPTRFPIHSCSPDPAFYEWTERKVNGAMEKIPPQFEKYDYYRKKGWYKAAEGMHVFGGIWGYQTSEGIVSVASLVHHGYIWQNGWILHAQKPNLEVKIPRKRSSEDCKFQSQKKKFGGRKRATQNLSSMPD